MKQIIKKILREQFNSDYLEKVSRSIDIPYFKMMDEHFNVTDHNDQLGVMKYILGDDIRITPGEYSFFASKPGRTFKIIDSKGRRIYYEDSYGWEKLEYNENNKCIYYGRSTGYWYKREYNENGEMVYYEGSDGEIIDNRNITESSYKEKIKNIVIESYKKTPLKNNKRFLNESTNILLSGDKKRYYNFLFESDDLLDVLLDTCLLTFSSGNAKVSPSTLIFALPAGWTCPFADECLKKVDKERYFDPEKINDPNYKGEVKWEVGKNTKIHCYSANEEMQYEAVRKNRWHNFDLLNSAGKSGGVKAQADLIYRSIMYEFEVNGYKNSIRIHESGDFYNQEYLEAWILVSDMLPNVFFYCYTKSLKYFINLKYFEKHNEKVGFIRNNFVVTYSMGGRLDDLVNTMDLKTAKVFMSPEEILESGLKVDIDESLAKTPGNSESSFALLLHGTQEKGEKSLTKLRNETFLNFWKYRNYLNVRFNKPFNNVWGKEEGLKYVKILNEKIKEGGYKKLKESELKDLRKLLNYVVKYHNYNFAPELINILPNKYKP
jgi:hypothetical protein